MGMWGERGGGIEGLGRGGGFLRSLCWEALDFLSLRRGKLQACSGVGDGGVEWYGSGYGGERGSSPLIFGGPSQDLMLTGHVSLLIVQRTIEPKEMLGCAKRMGVPG